MPRRVNNFYNTNNTKQSVEYSPKQLEEWYRKFFDKSFLYNEYGSLRSQVSWFCEDIILNLLPNYRNKNFISVAGDEESKNKVSYALGASSDDISEAVKNFIKKNWVIFNLLAYGKCWFEIVYNDNDDFIFELINPGGVLKLTKNHIYQYIPKLIREEKNLPIFKKLSSQDIFCIELSPLLKKKLKGVLSELNSLSENLIMPRFASSDLRNRSKFANFDQSWYNYQSNLRLARITKNTGWSCRSSLSGSTTEYYNLDKRLRFNKFLIELRSCIIDDLNKGLKKINLKDWSYPELRILNETSMTKKDVLEVEKLLKSGSVSFHDISLMSHFKK